MPFPSPMLARSGPLPITGGWAFEPKLDGFRCLIDTHDGFTARSRRGWNMTALLPELETLPEGLQLDAELVALDRRGHPDFYRLSRRMLHGDATIPVMLMAFDLLAVDGESLAHRPYAVRRERFEELPLDGPARVVPSFDDGEALWREILAHGLEGVVAKRASEPYRPGECSWIKRKNPNGPRFGEEREAAIRRHLEWRSTRAHH